VAVPASPRRRLAQRVNPPEEGHHTSAMDEYDYLRKLGDEEGRSMATLQAVEELLEHESHIPTRRKTGTAPFILQVGSSQLASQIQSPVGAPTEMKMPVASNPSGADILGPDSTQGNPRDVFDFGQIDTYLLNDD